MLVALCSGIQGIMYMPSVLQVMIFDDILKKTGIYEVYEDSKI